MWVQTLNSSLFEHWKEKKGGNKFGIQNSQAPASPPESVSKCNAWQKCMGLSYFDQSFTFGSGFLVDTADKPLKRSPSWRKSVCFYLMGETIFNVVRNCAERRSKIKLRNKTCATTDGFLELLFMYLISPLSATKGTVSCRMGCYWLPYSHSLQRFVLADWFRSEHTSWSESRTEAFLDM